MTSRWARRITAGLLLSLATLLAPGPAAQAHPFGDPQTVTISSSGETVSVVWRVGGADDLTLLGIELGVLPEDRVMLDGAITYDADDPAAVAQSEELHGYLLERVAVSVDGRSCPGEVTAVGDLLTEGATIEFTCDAPVAEADVTVRTLTDLHPAYRTLATGPSGQRAVYDESGNTHRFTFDPTAATTPDAADPAPPAADGQDLGRSAALQLGAVLGVVLLAVLAGAMALRRRGRTSTPTHPEKETARVPTTASPRS